MYLLVSRLAATLAEPATLSALEEKPSAELKSVHVAGAIELQYLERGKGDPIVVIHGGMADYSMCANQIGPFAQKYRVVAYSRRYNYPNTKTKYSRTTHPRSMRTISLLLYNGSA